MQGDEFDALVEDIRQRGLQMDIELYDGQIIDGRNRYQACLLADIDISENTTNITEYVNDRYSGDVVEYVLSLNLHRRHLDTSKRSLITVRRVGVHGLLVARSA